MRFISEKTAQNILIVIFSASLLFHGLVLAGILPNDIVWGGRTDLGNWQQFELVSIGVNLLLLLTVLWRKGSLPLPPKPRLLRVLFWGMTLLFALNTVGNLLAVTKLEMWLFTPLTFISTLLCLRLARS